MVSKIFHVADVHIRNFKRHSEYKAIFKQLFKYIKENADDNSIIYLAGDIVHSKNDMSPELVQMVADFFKSCADIVPTILITGNHDTNLNNDSRLDALSPIVSTLNHPNLYYWKDTGVYHLNGIAFSVFSVYSAPNEWIAAKDIDASYKIALHHGAVNSAITDLNHEIQNEFVGPKMFEGFDLSLLGDIHKKQYLDDKSTIAYAGSLIQQNHGEDLEHGILVWDVATKKSEFVKIQNSIGYATIEMVDGKIVTPRNYIDALPKNLNLRIKYTNTNYKDVTRAIQLLKTKHKLLETTVIKINNQEYLTNNSHTVLGDVRDVEYQNELLTLYMKDFNTNTHVDIDRLRHVNRVMNSKLDNSNVVVRNVIWKPLTFEFSNMFSYGEHNFIDFSNFNGIQGLFAPNASGKSTLLDAVTFCLFDKCSRTYRAKDVLNNKKAKFNCKLTFELNHQTYVIERIGQKHKRTGNVRVDVNFGKLVNGEYFSLNDIDRDGTNRVIRGYIGSYDDFLLTALSTQNDNKNFIFKTQRERKELLNSFLDISIFDDLYIIARNEIKGQQTLIKNLESEVIQDHYALLPEKVNNVQTKFTNISGSFVNQENILHQNENQLNQLRSQIQNIDEEIDIASVCSEIQDKLHESAILHNSTVNYKEKLKQSKNELNKSKKQFAGLNYDMIQDDKKQLVAITSQLQKYKETYARLSTNIKHFKEQIAHLENHEYDPNCQYCISNPFVQQAEDAKIKLPELLSQLEKLEDEIKYFKEQELNLKPKVESAELNYNNLKNEVIRLEGEISNIETNLENTNKLIKNTKERITYLQEQERKYYRQETIQLNNKKLQEEISVLESAYIENKNLYKRYQSDMMNYNSELASLQTSLKVWQDKQIQLNQLYDDVSIYETYLSAIAKNGIPHILLKKILPVIEDEVNSILNQIVEFYVTLEADDKNINCYLHYNDDVNWPVELASGMERFMISIAMRAALINVSSLPRPNFIAIDEGFGVLDSEKISSVNLLFDYLKTQFDFILCISHLDAMKDLADGLIHVTKSSSGFSEIKMA